MLRTSLRLALLTLALSLAACSSPTAPAAPHKAKVAPAPRADVCDYVNPWCH
jgi:hypothetical protein